jgi:hypothetical protein
MLIVVLASWLGIAGTLVKEGEEDGLYKLLYDWQTLIGALIARVAALVVHPVGAVEIVTDGLGCPVCPSSFWWLVGAGALGLFAGANIGLAVFALFFTSGGRDD